jgi:hypothetical protein
MHAAWLALSHEPSRIADERDTVATAALVRELLYWNDRGNVARDEYGTDADCRYSLLRSMAGDAASWYDCAMSEFGALGLDVGDDGAEKTLVRCDEMACLIDPARASEAYDMVDDWEARLGLSDHVAGELRAAVTDNYYVFERA